MRIANIVLAIVLFLVVSASAQWEQTPGPNGGPVSSYSVNSSNNYIFAVAGSNTNSYAGVFRSTDGGATWTPQFAGTTGDFSAYTVTTFGTHTFMVGVANSTGQAVIYHSTDYGDTWTALSPTGLPGFWAPRMIYASGTNLLMSTIITAGLYLSTDNGASWTATSGVPATADIAYFTARGSYLYAGTSAASATRAIYRSKDGGSTWTAADISSFGGGYITGLAANANGVYATTALSGAYRSNDSGQVWTKINPDVSSNFASSIAASSTNVYEGVGMLVYKGDASGNGLVSSSTGLPPTNAGAGIYSFATSGSTVLASAGKLGIWRSTNNGTSWAESNAGLRAAQLNGLFGYAPYVFAASESNGFFRTANHGASWIEVDSGVNRYIGWYNVVRTPGGAYLGGSGTSTIYRSTDAGLHWNSTTGNTLTGTFAFTIGGGDTVYATGFPGIEISIDGGQNWTTATSGFLFYETGLDIIKRGPYLMVSSNVGQKRSLDDGQTWTAPVSGLSGSGGVGGWAKLDTILFAAGASGVLKSEDNGATWTTSNAGVVGFPRSILAVGPTLFVGTSTSVCRSDDSGQTWVEINQGLPTKQIVSKLAADDLYLFAGTPGRSVWRRLLSQITAVGESEPSGLPSGYRLSQNYPNPFNPSTTIEFTLPSRSHVSIDVFNIVGQRVRTLLNDAKSPGTYRVEWDGKSDAGTSVSTGLYLYRFRAGDVMQTKKMLFLK